jgi:hypothetical protein
MAMVFAELYFRKYNYSQLTASAIGAIGDAVHSD